MSPAGKPSTANSGSPPLGEPEYLVVGTLRRPHGLRGEMLMEVVTDFPERLRPGTAVAVGEEHRSFSIAACRKHARGLLIRFDGMTTPDVATHLRNQPVFVKTADRPKLPVGSYYHHELLGLDVFSADSGLLGILFEILQTGANDVFVVRSEAGSELLLPAIPSVLLEVDRAQRKILVKVPDGLAPEPASSSTGLTGRRSRGATS